METNLVELSLGLSFTAMNVWMDEAIKYSFAVITSTGRSWRAMLWLASLIAVYATIWGNTAFLTPIRGEPTFVRAALQPADEGASDRYLAFAEKVATDSSIAPARRSQHQDRFSRAAENLPMDRFVDSSPDGGARTTRQPCLSRSAAFRVSQTLLPPDGAKTLIALLVDYAGARPQTLSQGSLIPSPDARAPADELRTKRIIQRTKGRICFCDCRQFSNATTRTYQKQNAVGGTLSIRYPHLTASGQISQTSISVMRVPNRSGQPSAVILWSRATAMLYRALTAAGGAVCAAMLPP
jgi:hypothetical protein